MKKKLTLAVIISLLSSGLVAQEAVLASLPDNPSREDVVRLATEVRPSYRQLDCQQREILGFIHIGMNTFTGGEWGAGKENPSLFNPSRLDANKWVKTFKDVGITGVILVAKHHDGFCVWPSKYTSHTVAASPWRNGKGDLVREVADACRKYDMKLCLYLSPWDMHEKTSGTKAYNDYYIHQLEELLTNYGPVYLLWFDAAGTTSEVSGVKMPFDWERIFSKARKLQPDVLLSGNAPDIRWVGNEKGKGRETDYPDEANRLRQRSHCESCFRLGRQYSVRCDNRRYPFHFLAYTGRNNRRGSGSVIETTCHHQCYKTTGEYPRFRSTGKELCHRRMDRQ